MVYSPYQKFGFLPFVIGLLYGIPAVPDAQFLHGLIGQFLDVEPVDDTAGLGKYGPYDFVHGVREVKGDFLNRVAAFLVNPFQDCDYTFRFRAGNNRYKGTLTCTGGAVGYERIQFAVGKRGLVNGKTGADVLREQQPIVRMFQLVPLPETAEDFLVLLLKRVAVDMVELLKRMAGHGGRLHTSLLKKLQILWSNVSLWLRHRGLSEC